MCIYICITGGINHLHPFTKSDAPSGNDPSELENHHFE